MLTLTDIIFLFLLLTAAMFAWQATAVREFAVKAVKNHLRQLDLQLLEDTVAWSRLRWQGGRVLRVYQFEFSSMGNERYSGIISMSGFHVENIELEAYRVPPPPFEQLH